MQVSMSDAPSRKNCVAKDLAKHGQARVWQYAIIAAATRWLPPIIIDTKLKARNNGTTHVVEWYN